MKFDINAARSSGYSDDEIADYLAKENSFDLGAALKSGYSASEVVSFLSGAEAPAAAPVTDTGDETARLAARYKAPEKSFLPKPMDPLGIGRGGPMGAKSEEGLIASVGRALKPEFKSVMEDYQPTPEQKQAGADRRLSYGAGPISQQTEAAADLVRSDMARSGDATVKKVAKAMDQQQVPGFADLARRANDPVNVRAERDAKAEEFRTVGEWAADTLSSLSQGTVGLVQLPINIIAPSSEIASTLQKTQKELQAQESDVLKAQREQLRERVQNEDGFFDKYAATVVQLVTSPALGLSEAVKQIPNFLGIVGASRLAGAAAAGSVGLIGRASPTVALGEAISGGAIQAGARAAGTTAGGVGASMVMAGGDAAGGVYDKLTDPRQTPLSVWRQNPDYQELVASGKTSDQAIVEIATAKARMAALVTAPLGLLGFMGAEAAVASRGLGRATAEALTAAGAGKLLAKDLVGEQLEEGGTQFGGNVISRTVDPSQDLSEGVPEAMGTALVTSAPFSAVGAASQYQEARAAQAPDLAAARQAVALFDVNNYDPALVDPMQTSRGGMVGPSAPINFTPADSPSAQAGLAPIVVPLPGQQETTDVSATSIPPLAATGSGDLASDQFGGGLDLPGSAVTDAAGQRGGPAGVAAPDGAEAVALPSAAGKPAAGLSRPFDRATDQDLLARTEASIASQENNNDVVQPAEQWFGRKGDGYVTQVDAQQALPGRQRMFPTLDWKVESMANGKFRLAGYSKETTSGTQAPQAIQGQAQRQEAPAVGAAAAIAAPVATANVQGPLPAGLKLAPPAPIGAIKSVRAALQADSGLDVAPVSLRDMNDSQKLASTVARLLGKTLTVITRVSGPEMSMPNGLINRAGGKHIMIADDTVDAPLFVTMHEAYHGLADDKRAALNTALRQLFREDKTGEFKQVFNYTDAQLDEEIPAFMVQAISKRADFWEELRAKMGNAEFADVAKAILSKLNQILTGARSEYGDEFVNTYITDVAKARDLLTTAYAQAMQEQGLTPDTAATGDATTPATRLQQAAAPQAGVTKDESIVDGILYSNRKRNLVDIPTIELKDLVGKKVFGIKADLTDAGRSYAGIDGSQLEFPVEMMGGPNYVRLPENASANVIWAVRGGAVLTKIMEQVNKSDYVLVHAMNGNSHLTNSTISTAYLQTVEAYLRDGRISKENLLALDEIVRSPKNKSGLPDFPGFESPEIYSYIDGLSFDQRGALASILEKKEAQIHGLPNLDRFRRETIDPEFAGYRQGDAMLVLKVDKKNPTVRLGEEGTKMHPSYPLGLRGKVIGKFAKGINYETIFRDYFNFAVPNFKNKEAGAWYAFDRKMPIQKITQDIADSVAPGSFKAIKTARQAEASLAFANGNWLMSGKTKAQGGVSVQEFVDALAANEGAAALTLYKPDEVKAGIKDNSFTVYQLGKEGGDKGLQVFFGLKRGAPWYKDMIDGVTDNEVEVVSVTNNESGAPGIAIPAIITKAISEGATVLDAFAVKSERFPNGFLPEMYAQFGFEEIGRIQFDPSYYDANQMADLKSFWSGGGWKEADGYPDVVVMRWKGNDEDRGTAVERYVRSGATGIPGQRLEYSRATAAESRGPSDRSRGKRGGARGTDGAKARGDQGAGDAASVVSRAFGSIQELAGLSDGDIRNLGLDPVEIQRLRTGLASVQRSSRAVGPAGPAGRPGVGRDQGDAVKVAGAVHYGRQGGLSVLSGVSFGSGIRGAEQARLAEPRVDARIKRRVYFYLPVAGGIPQPELGLGGHVYSADLSNLYDPAAGSRTFPATPNEFESAILDAGFRGYINREQGTAVVLNSDVPVKYQGTTSSQAIVPRKIERAVAVNRTRAAGDELVRRPEGNEMIGIIKARPALAEAAPSFKMEFGEARVKQSEAEVADRVLAEAGATFQFGGVMRSNRAKPAFYSQLERTIANVPAKLATQPAAQWALWLDSNGPKQGVKKDEMEWSGIKDYLTLRGKEKVTSAELQAYLADSGVRVSEEMLGQDAAPSDLSARQVSEIPESELKNFPGYDYFEPSEWLIFRDGDTWVGTLDGPADSAEEAVAKFREEADDEGYVGVRSSGEPKYGKYQLPGGENYREVLITLPGKTRATTMEQALSAWKDDARAGKRGNYTADEINNMDAENISDILQQEYLTPKDSDQYRSTHWDQKNVLAHIRVNDRTDADGKRVLFVEEVQSDWGQEGKKKGFSNTKLNMENPVVVFNARTGENVARFRTGAAAEAYIAEQDPGMATLDYEDTTARGGIEQGLVPAAPFVTKTEGWLNLALKRIAMMAVEGGYDKVAFVNGEQSAAHYDLSKQVSRVDWDEDSEVFYGYDFNGRKAITKGQIKADDLPGLVGKEVAQRLINAERVPQFRGDTKGPRILSGLDLKVGDRGMKAFYDEIVPQAITKLLPKLGGDRLLTVDAGNANEVKRKELTAKIRNLPFNSKERAALTDEMYAIEQGYTPLEQPGFDVTDKMRETVGQGVPMFSKRAAPDTPAFRKWFGDSKVVDESGEPLVVYHGTAYDVEAFDPKRIGYNFPTDSAGIYFSTSPEAASNYAEFAADTSDDGLANVMPVYLSIKSPYRIDGGDGILDENIDLIEEIKSEGVHDGIVSTDKRGYTTYIAFSPTQIKSATGNDGNFNATNPDIRKSNRRQKLSTMGQTFELPATGKIDAARIKLQDDALRMKRVIEAVKAKGGVVGEAQNFYDANTLMPGRIQAAIDDFKNSIVRPMLDKAAEYGIDMDELSMYSYAKHAKERNAYIASINKRLPDGGSGMTNDEADNILQMVDLAGDKAKFEELHQALMGITSATRQIMLAEGLITPDEFASLEGAYDNYIPLRGFENVDEETGVARPGVGRGVNVRGAETVRAMGRKSKAGDLIENVIRDYERVIARVEKNDVAKVLLDFVLSNPDPDLWGVDVERSKPSFNKAQGTVQYTKSIEKGEDTIGLKVGGEQVYIKFADKELTRALRQAWKDETSGLERATLAMTGWWNNWLRAVLTKYNPAFALINIPRDALWSGTASALAELGPKGLASYLAAYPKAFMASARQEAGLAGSNSRLFGNPKMDARFAEFRSAGGITGGFFMRTLDDINQEMRNELLMAGASARNPWEQVKKLPPFKLAKLTLKLLEFMGSASENATRFALYQASREQGNSPAKAGILAKDGTTNFNRKGEWGGALNNLYLFFNAAVQGNAQLFKVLKSPAVQASMAGVAGVGMMLALYGASAGGEDDDGEAYWDKIPSYVKERNVVIMLPPGDALAGGIERVGKRGRYITIPVQYGFNMFPNAGYVMADVLRNAQDPKRGMTPTKAALHMTSTVLGSVNPFGGAVDVSDGVQVLLAAMPTLADLPIQLINERGTFGTPSSPFKSPWDVRPDSERMFTSQQGTMSAKIAEALNELGGGNEAKAGKILGVETSVTPGTIQTLISATTGGLGTFVEQVGSSVIAMTGDDQQPKASKIPFLNKFYGEVDEGANIKTAGDRMREVKKLSDEVKAQQKLGLDPELTSEEDRLLSLAGMQATYQRQSSMIRKQELEIIKDDSKTKAEKALLKKQLQVERDKLATEMNREYLRVVPK
jgi:hypothetical protein